MDRISLRDASRLLGLVACFALTAGCNSSRQFSTANEVGAAPDLVEPQPQFFPTVEVAEAVGWSDGETPVAAAGLRVQAFATGLQHPRWLHVLPNGDVLVAESTAPPDSRAASGLKGKIMGRLMAKAGAGVPNANRISLLRDADGDGVAERNAPYIEGLRSPFGMALVGSTLYVANADSLMAFSYVPAATRIAEPGRQVASLPRGPGSLNHHWTKSLLASPDGRFLYVGVGSNSNIAEGGMDKETQRAVILRIARESGTSDVYASGLRNPVGIDWEPSSGKLWTVVNERDALGDALVPDYLTSVQQGAFYGWPYSYFGRHVDPRVKPPRPDLVATALVPDYALGAHVAPLGLAFYTGSTLPERFRGGALVGLHGSWNRDDLTGYKVVLVRFANGRPVGTPEDVLAGFLNAQGQARGRPVGVAIAADGSVLVADDVGNTVWRVSAIDASSGSPAP